LNVLEGVRGDICEARQVGRGGVYEKKRRKWTEAKGKGR
jgi:hypothetical protein